ncbi:MAG TPA: hypothetical protein VH500_24975 [Nitrososphaeraceae archaeon]|jgi:hypothetical protein
MNNKTGFAIAAVAIFAALLITTAASNAYAGGHGHHGHFSKTKQSQSQSLAQANACGNGKFPYEVNCQNAASQIQGKGNFARVTASQ